ncbi:MAG: hypothetical protein Q7V01_12755 [Vicinamibacterales bacterium]|jgi:hypothetical protein|nr:hypothetical protein [Vicinamibacterales bacterium]
MNRARPSLQKREREKSKREKQQQKLARRSEVKTQRPVSQGGEDPDLAGIVPGPQPKPWDDDEQV